MKVPSSRPFNAMLNRQALTFLRGEIILVVRIFGKNDDAIRISGSEPHFMRYSGYDRAGFGCAQRTGDEVVLHINDDENFFSFGGLLNGGLNVEHLSNVGGDGLSAALVTIMTTTR